MRHEIAFPEIKTFSELFPEAQNHDVSGGKMCPALHEYETDEVEYTGKSRREFKGRCVLSSSCSVRRPDAWQFLQVKPRDGMVEWIEKNMLLLDCDTISFEVVVRDDGTALLLAHYSQIIGSRWLALVDASTLPAPLEEDSR